MSELYKDENTTIHTYCTAHVHYDLNKVVVGECAINKRRWEMNERHRARSALSRKTYRFNSELESGPRAHQDMERSVHFSSKRNVTGDKIHSAENLGFCTSRHSRPKERGKGREGVPEETPKAE